jgi:D-2-hydroxyacid dehydrogenase (NADP+)
MTVVLWVKSKQLDNLSLKQRHREALERALPGSRFIYCESREQFLEALPEAEAASSWLFKPQWFERAARLKLLVSPAAGREFFPAEAPAGVRLEFSGFHGTIMAETVLGMMLSHARRLLQAARLQTELPWPRRELEPGQRLFRGSKVTVLGFGHIGEQIGRLVKALGARITGLRRNPGSRPDYFGVEDRLLPAERLDEILPATDHLAVCLPATAETSGILDARRLELLPEEAGIYNVGRGNALDEQALAELLRRRPLCEAYLDVFREEPLPAASPLRPLPNCLILPHVSANAPEYLDLFVEELIGLLRRG